MELDSGLVWLSFAPIALGGGAWRGAAVLVAILVAAPFSRTLFNADERAMLGGYLRHQLDNLAALLWKQPQTSGSMIDSTYRRSTFRATDRSTASRKTRRWNCRGRFACHVPHHEHASRRRGDAARRTRAAAGSPPFPAGDLLPEGTRPARRRAGPRDSRSTTICSRANTTCASGRGWCGCLRERRDRRGHHRRRRRQDVLGPARRPARRRAGHSLGAAQHRLAGRRRPAQPAAHADHRRLHRRRRLARRAHAGQGRLPRRKGVRDSQRRRHRPLRADCPMSTAFAASSASARPTRSCRSSPRCGRRRITSCSSKWPPACCSNSPTRKFLIVGDGPRREPLEQRAAELGNRRERPLPRHAQRRAAAARGERRVRAHLAQRSEPGLDPRSDERRRAGRRHRTSARSAKRSATARPATSCRRATRRSSPTASRACSSTTRFARQAMGAAAREVVVERWSIDAMVRGYERLIEIDLLPQAARHGQRVARTGNTWSTTSSIAEWQDAEIARRGVDLRPRTGRARGP